MDHSVQELLWEWIWVLWDWIWVLWACIWVLWEWIWVPWEGISVLWDWMWVPWECIWACRRDLAARREGRSMGHGGGGKEGAPIRGIIPSQGG